MTKQKTVTEINEISLLDMANGGVAERIAYELPQIINNIADPNTAAKKMRSMTIKVKFTPTEDRGFTAVEFEVSSKLQPTDPISATLMLQHFGDKVQAIEIGKQAPGQLDLDGNEEPQAAVIKQI
jgi:hypothetical protein